MKRLLLASLLVVACGKKDSSKPAPAAPPASSAAASKPAAPVESKAEAPKPPPAPELKINLQCAKVVPKDMRDKYFKGMAEKEEQPGGPTSVNCNYAKDNKMEPLSVSVMCPHWVEPQFAQSMTAGKAGMTDAKDLKGVGRMAIVDGADQNAQVWDDDTMCLITVSAPHASEIAKDETAAVSPTTIQ